MVTAPTPLLTPSHCTGALHNATADCASAYSPDGAGTPGRLQAEKVDERATEATAEEAVQEAVQETEISAHIGWPGPPRRGQRSPAATRALDLASAPFAPCASSCFKYEYWGVRK